MCQISIPEGVFKKEIDESTLSEKKAQLISCYREKRGVVNGLRGFEADRKKIP
jgi:hypothetical protein